MKFTPNFFLRERTLIVVEYDFKFAEIFESEYPSKATQEVRIKKQLLLCGDIKKNRC